MLEHVSNGEYCDSIFIMNGVNLTKVCVWGRSFCRTCFQFKSHLSLKHLSKLIKPGSLFLYLNDRVTCLKYLFVFVPTKGIVLLHLIKQAHINLEPKQPTEILPNTDEVS